MSSSSVARLPGWSLCSQCLSRRAIPSATRTLQRSSIHTKRKLHGTIIPDKTVQRNMVIQSQPSFHDYFSANTSIDRGWIKNGFLAALRTAAESPKAVSPNGSIGDTFAEPPENIQEQGSHNTPTAQALNIASINNSELPQAISTVSQHSQDHILPHRRRRHRLAQANENSESSRTSAETEEQLPLDASSQLTTAAAALPTSATMRRKFATYLSLTKPRLSFLIILTTASAYSLYPIPEILSNATLAADASSTLSTSTLTLTFLTVGTFLCSASANTFNMLFEPRYDALMSRTRNRPLVRKLISQRAALVFALLCGGSGILLLGLGTNSTVAALGALNVFLYAGVYTPMKRLSPINTWVGAIVGGIPPLMGWCAAAGEAATSEHHSWRDLLLSEDSIGGWLLAGLLFAWQFPHFNSLSHTIREDYRNAGHKMLAWMNPARNARVALRYSLAMFPICAGLYWAGVVNQGFLAISTVCNVWMTKEAIQFYKKQGAGGSAKRLFWASVWQLPLVLVGALVCKTGIWDGMFEKEEDPVSIYEDIEVVGGNSATEGEGLGMSVLAVGSERPSEHNMAMLGFKRPS